MATRTALALHVPARPAERRGLVQHAGKLVTELGFALVLVAGATVAVVLLFLLAVLAAPLAAAFLVWLMWRSGDLTSREARRVRARLRRRARALGLVVLAGSQPTLLRLATAGSRSPPATRTER
jgi:hypothetical protein